MEIRILDTSFNALCVVEKYESFIWTDRFNEYGDFELYGPFGERWMDYIEIGRYVSTTDSDRLMIIESYEITTDKEAGNFVRVTGRSLESILLRRVVWTQTIITGSAQTILKKVIDDSIINPTLPERRIDNFVFEESTDAYINKSIGEAQYTGDVIYTIVSDICKLCGLGFKIVLNKDKQFVFSLFRGTDRSRTVTFSPEYNNLLSSEYSNNYQNYYNVTLVAGEGQGTARKTVVVGNVQGLDRKELYTDARDLVSTGTTAANYLNQLAQRGSEKLSETQITEGFQGEVDPVILYRYGVDYFMGDKVTFKDSYGNVGTPIIEELIISYDENSGYRSYPTFVMEGDK